MENPTSNYKHSDFPLGSKVQIISYMVDFHFFRGTETGTVIKNNGGYLGINVQLDKPRHYESGHIMTYFNFNPNNLVPIAEEDEEEINPWLYHVKAL